MWLLHQYGQQGGTLAVAMETDALFRFAFRHGFDQEHGGIHDQVAPGGTPLLRTRRIWPVAEAIKACVAMTEAGQDHRADADHLAAHLLRGFVPPGRPGWHETLTRDGVPSMTDLPGSTPYHLFLAAMEAERLPAAPLVRAQPGPGDGRRANSSPRMSQAPARNRLRPRRYRAKDTVPACLTRMDQ